MHWWMHLFSSEILELQKKKIVNNNSNLRKNAWKKINFGSKKGSWARNSFPKKKKKKIWKNYIKI